MANEKRTIAQLQEFYDSLVERPCKRLGITLEEAAELGNKKPPFVQATERRAERLGTTPDHSGAPTVSLGVCKELL